MREENNKYNAINNLETDYRAEVVAAGIIESGLDADKILIVRQKGDKRYVSKDIAEVKNDFSKEDLMEYLYIYTNRNSIYDAIPENVFHQPFETAKRKTQEDIINEIRRHREEEFYARRYFQPFEMAVDQLLIDAQLYERQFDKKNFHSNLKDIFSGYWSVLKLLTLKQAVFFIKIIPILHRVTTSFDLVGKLMGIILEAPVKVELGELSEIKTAIPLKITPGKWKLGVNSTLGNTFKDGYRDINITIGPVHPEIVKSFSKGYNNYLILEQLITMMLPANTQRNVRYKTLEEYAKFRLSDKTHTAYLGINTRL
ncbi:type VI secretion system baseplate subunit TssG [Dysgonomonas sp. 511]|uniref:type VI secretion system baseplate subunit TssG n=1 Tax=Dysgonomonas sp. 511 TaxID=2302930 RepID=UPI0013D705B1|nr:type VI secretion system baseplate subunit TssG [Dysgonomonas sp. 511]NDV78480.1 hypothetical protein [Dysgonomonas sp. 511]